LRVGKFYSPLVTATFDSDPVIFLNIPGEIDCNNKIGLALDSALHHLLGLRKALKTAFKRRLMFLPKSRPSDRLFLLSLCVEYAGDGWMFSVSEEAPSAVSFSFLFFPY
jgi:hypothetical protein